MLSYSEENAGEITAAELTELVEREASDCDGVLALFSDCVWGGTYDEFRNHLDCERVSHLLEARAFDRNGELRIMRGDLGRSFLWRSVLDRSGVAMHDRKAHWYDEVQYLDIDQSHMKEGDGRDYKSMSGGSYRLPIQGAERVVLRNYVEYDGQGLASIEDFRIVALLKKQEEWTW